MQSQVLFRFHRPQMLTVSIRKFQKKIGSELEGPGLEIYPKKQKAPKFFEAFSPTRFSSPIQ
jgi:hypothetical protein